MKYRRVTEFPSVTAAEQVVRCAYGAKIPSFDRAEVFKSEKGDCVLRTFGASGTRHYRIESDGAAGWIFFGGILLLNPNDLNDDPVVEVTPNAYPGRSIVQ